MDRGQTGRRAARTQARAALAGPRKCGRGRVFAALWPRALVRASGQWSSPGPFSPGAYKYPRGLQLGDIQRRELYFVALLGVVVVVVVLFLVLVLAIRVKERESV